MPAQTYLAEDTRALFYRAKALVDEFEMSVVRACRRVGLPRSTYYFHLKEKTGVADTTPGKSDQANEDVAGPTVEHNQSITSPAPQTTEV